MNTMVAGLDGLAWFWPDPGTTCREQAALSARIASVDTHAIDRLFVIPTPRNGKVYMTRSFCL
jgi:hypothetical protein